MADSKKVSDLMINVFDYPHLPYWFSICQAIEIMKISFPNSGPRPDPVAILVFDEKYNLIGIVTQKELLIGLEPKCRQSENGKDNECDIEENLFKRDLSKADQRPVSEIMVPVRHFIGPGESAAKAAFIMITHGLFILPVLEDQRNLVGLVRLSDLFDYLSSASQ
jgi:CBS-domain-containing membrane protein